jgi:cytochrome oxidase Cu insertion factor (SCO1/SenC/PrrC family)
MKGKFLFSALAMAMILLLLSGLGQNAFTDVGEGDIVDNFTLPDFDGNTHTLYDYEGHVIFINSWAIT